MDFVVRYRGYKIIRSADHVPWRVYRDVDDKFIGEFTEFMYARQEVDTVSGRGRYIRGRA